MKILRLLLKFTPTRLKTKKAILSIMFILVLIFVGNKGGANKELIEIASVTSADIKSEVFATGQIESINDSTLNFPVSGKVVWVNVQKGDHVKEGQAIASLDKEKFEIAIRQAQQDVVAADAVLLKTYDDLPNNETETFQEKIDRTAAEKTKNQAFDALKLAERNIKDILLVSPIEGTIVNLNIKVGEEILLTEIVARVADTDNLQFSAEVDESDIGLIKIGQSTTIYLEAFPGDEIESSVNSLGFEGVLSSTQSTVFEVIFEIIPNDKYILGMNGDVQIITQKNDNVLLIPIEALFDEDIVWLKTNGKYMKTDVDVGIQNDVFAEILRGLDEGSEVVISGFNELEKESLVQKILPF